LPREREWATVTGPVACERNVLGAC
jgi:hypothetical protein